MVPACSHEVPRVSRYSGYCCLYLGFVYGAFTLFGGMFHIPSTTLIQWSVQSTTPQCTHYGLGFVHFARRYFGYRVFFLLLRLLRCFSSPGSLRMTMYLSYGDRDLPCRVSPFRNLRITGYVLLPAAYRSLSRLSSALSAKASTLRS